MIPYLKVIWCISSIVVFIVLSIFVIKEFKRDLQFHGHITLGDIVGALLVISITSVFWFFVPFVIAFAFILGPILKVVEKIGNICVIKKK